MLNVYKRFDKPSELKDYKQNYFLVSGLEKLHVDDDDDGEGEYLGPITEEEREALAQNQNIILKLSPHMIIDYINDVLGGPWPEAEPILMKDPPTAFWYANTYINNNGRTNPPKRWEKAEPYIMKNPEYAYYYAETILQRRWLEAEPYIKENEYWWKQYADYFKIND
jgi:hypothetical protein